MIWPLKLYDPHANPYCLSILSLCILPARVDGNMFTLDGNCIHMVDNGIVQKLINLLDGHVEGGNVTVQHAALSALRNLAIPGKFTIFHLKVSIRRNFHIC